MVGFIIATHGGFAQGILDSVKLITGVQDKISVLSLYHETNIDDFGESLVNEIQKQDDGDGVIVFCDLLMASPYNQATLNYKKILKKHKYKVISGLNLPMLLEAISCRMQNFDLEKICSVAQKAGQDGIKEFFEEFNKLGLSF